MKQFFILLLLLFIFCCTMQLKAQCDCLNDPFVVGPEGLKIPGCGPGDVNFCQTNYFDGPMNLSGDINAFTAVAGDWMLIIDEEFNGPLDSTIWHPRMPWSNKDSDNGYPGVNSLEIPENLNVSNGILHFRGRYDNDPTVLYDVWNGDSKLPTGLHSDYTSACLTSRYQFPLNSRFQINAKMFPDPSTTGSELWLYGGNSQEIDIQELYSGTNSGTSSTESKSTMVMGVHGDKYGGGANHAEYSVLDISSYIANIDLTQNLWQYDLIWDKWKTEFWFNGSVIKELCKYYYCPSSWTNSHLQSHLREHPMRSQSDMLGTGENHYAVLQYFPDYSPMTLILGIMPDGGSASQYNAINPDGSAVNSMDVDFVKVWLRASCSSGITVNAVNYGTTAAGITGNTNYEMGKTVTTSSGQSLIIASDKNGVYAATDEVALMDGFGTDRGANFHAFITYCQTAWDHREANNTHPVITTVDSQITLNTLNLDSLSFLGVDSVKNIKLSMITVSPNPSDGTFTLNGAIQDLQGKLYVSIFDLQGNVIKQEYPYNIGDKIDMTALQNGVYNISIRSTDATVISTNKKLIIAK